MAKQPAGGSSVPAQQPDGASGFTASTPDNAAAAAEAAADSPIHHLHHRPAPPPPCSGNEGKTFSNTENKPGELDSSRAYGTFKNAAPAAPEPVAGNSALGMDSVGSARVGSGQCVDPLRAEQNNTAGNWTTMSQTTIILGTDGITSVQAVAAAGVSQHEAFPPKEE